MRRGLILATAILLQACGGESEPVEVPSPVGRWRLADLRWQAEVRARFATEWLLKESPEEPPEPDPDRLARRELRAVGQDDLRRHWKRWFGMTEEQRIESCLADVKEDAYELRLDEGGVGELINNLPGGRMLSQEIPPSTHQLPVRWHESDGVVVVAVSLPAPAPPGPSQEVRWRHEGALLQPVSGGVPDLPVLRRYVP